MTVKVGRGRERGRRREEGEGSNLGQEGSGGQGFKEWECQGGKAQ